MNHSILPIENALYFFFCIMWGKLPKLVNSGRQSNEGFFYNLSVATHT